MPSKPESRTIPALLNEMVRALIDHPDRARRDISSLRAGGTIGTPEQIAEVATELGASEVSDLYGLTESYGNATVADAHDCLELRMASVGRPLPGSDLIIVGAGEETALRALAREALAAYKRPRAYRFITAAEVPLTSTGKVRKAALPALFAEAG